MRIGLRIGGFVGVAAVALGCWLSPPALAEDEGGETHVGRFSKYEGTRTCLGCHREEAVQMHSSVHYQWKGDSRDIVNAAAPRQGKLGGLNDFCVYPDINWLGKLTNASGQLVDGGCARCHTGLGLKPTAEATEEQLENIDCMVCHSDQYKRKVESVGGVFKLVPDEARMSVPLLEAAQNVAQPSSGACLNCHARSGGGNNNKRGDIEEEHRNPSASFDVHLAPESQGGAGLTCLSCHDGDDHRIAGRGVDLAARDTTATVACTNCHDAAPHESSRLNRHTDRVNCNTCHIPRFAKVAATDMERDYSAPATLDPATGLYEPFMVKRNNVVPEYRFWIGKSTMYQFGEPATPGPSGRILMAGPVGVVTDPGARIQPLKRHLATQPIDPVSKRLLPLKMKTFFETGDVGRAVQEGVAAVGWTYNGHDFAATERYMGLFHEVAPAEQALNCNDCHYGGQRLDFDLLGYAPKATRNGKPLCASCHRDRSARWKGDAFFTNVHKRHVDDRKLDCSACHGFARAR